MNSKIKGTICGVFAAISYGMNPLGALNLYQEGLNVNSVIFYRYGLATTILALIMLAQKKSFAITRREFAVLSVLGVLMVVSSLALFGSFNFMDAGVASTLLFVYPQSCLSLFLLLLLCCLYAIVCISRDGGSNDGDILQGEGDANNGNLHFPCSWRNQSVV